MREQFGRAAVATAVGGLLVVGGLAAPPQSLAAYAKGSWAGNSTAAIDEPLSFKVKKNKKGLKKAKKQLRKAKKKLKEKKQADEKVKEAKKKVKEAKKKVKERKPKVKKLEMETVVMSCTESETIGGPPVREFFSAQAVPIGSLFDSKNAARIKKDGSFSLTMKSNRHLDEGQEAKFKGKLSKNSAEGKFLIEYNSHFVQCRSGRRSWMASPVG